MNFRLVHVELSRTICREEYASVIVQVPQDATSEEIETLCADESIVGEDAWDYFNSWTEDISATASDCQDENDPDTHFVRDEDGSLRIVTEDEALEQMFEEGDLEDA